MVDRELAAFEEWLIKSASMGVGQWWEQVGGPHLAKGGKHSVFKKMMEEEGIPEKQQERFMRMAKEKYPEGHNEPSSGYGGGTPDEGGRQNPFTQTGHALGNLGRAAIAAPFVAAGLYSALSPKEEDPHTRVPEWRGHVGSYLANVGSFGGLGFAGGRLANILGNRNPNAPLIGAGIGVLAGLGMGELAHRKSELDARRDGERAARTGKDKSLLRRASETQGHLAGQAAISALPTGIFAALRNIDPLPLASILGANIFGSAMAQKRRNAAAVEHMDRLRKKTKHAAGAPTRGNFMMASDIPAFQAPRLDRAIQKNSGETTMPVGKPKEKTEDFLPNGVTYNEGDFKRSKYAMSTQELEGFVTGLLKQAMTPAGQLAQTQSIGAPKASPPPGPSIADIAKPKGARFGTGIAGAFKTTIGGTAGNALK